MRDEHNQGRDYAKYPNSDYGDNLWDSLPGNAETLKQKTLIPFTKEELEEMKNE